MNPNPITLSPQESAWLQMIAPEKVHESYTRLYEKKKPGEKVALSDKSAFNKFVTGKKPIHSRDVAEIVFEAYGTTWEQLETIERLPLRLPSFGTEKEAEVEADAHTEHFFQRCGDLLWGCGTDGVPAETGHQSPEAEAIESVLLDLVGCVLARKNRLTANQKHFVFGELLDYLLEKRQFERWGEWMVSLSHESNRQLFPNISKNRAKPSEDYFFPGCRRDARGKRQYDQQTLENLGASELNDCAFFVRRLNMRINELRHRNYADKLKEFERIAGKGDSASTLADALQEMRDEGRILVRHYFRWALENVKPFLEALQLTKNPHRWYFLLCATRLMYDWAKWHFSSVLAKEDTRAACDMYRDIFELAMECDGDAGLAVQCRFKYMASTACRYMAEGASADVWGKQSEAASYVLDAEKLAKQAMEDWENKAPKTLLAEGKELPAGESEVPAKERKVTVGEFKALKYRLTRHYARQATFAARWWLMHPSRYGGNPNMSDDEKLTSDIYGVHLLKEANKKYVQDICSSLEADSVSGCKHIVDGKRLLDYEFHLRVWLEMLVRAFEEEESEDALTRAKMAMSIFCRMILIYAYLFRVEADADRKEKSSALSLQTVDAAKQWIEQHDYYTDHITDSPFSLFDPDSEKPITKDWTKCLEKTIQQKPPSIIETRFEMVCAFKYKYDSWHPNRPGGNLLWRTLNTLKLAQLDKETGVEEFLANVWTPARDSLDADLKDSVKKIKLAPFQTWKALVNTPGNNPVHVEALMRHFGLEWDAAKKEKGAAE